MFMFMAIYFSILRVQFSVIALVNLVKENEPRKGFALRVTVGIYYTLTTYRARSKYSHELPYLIFYYDTKR